VLWLHPIVAATMPGKASQRTVLLSVRPRLFADTLAKSLTAEERLHVVIDLEEADRFALLVSRFDIAVVSCATKHVNADVTIYLHTESCGAGVGTLTAADGLRHPIQDLDHLIAWIRSGSGDGESG
jgi:hypothetical protein